MNTIVSLLIYKFQDSSLILVCMYLSLRNFPLMEVHYTTLTDLFSMQKFLMHKVRT